MPAKVTPSARWFYGRFLLIAGLPVVLLCAYSSSLLEKVAFESRLTIEGELLHTQTTQLLSLLTKLRGEAEEMGRSAELREILSRLKKGERIPAVEWQTSLRPKLARSLPAGLTRILFFFDLAYENHRERGWMIDPASSDPPRPLTQEEAERYASGTETLLDRRRICYGSDGSGETSEVGLVVPLTDHEGRPLDSAVVALYPVSVIQRVFSLFGRREGTLFLLAQDGSTILAQGGEEEGRERALLEELHPERLERIFAAGNGSLTDDPRMLILFSATEVERTPDTWHLIEMVPKELVSSGLHPQQIALFLATLLLLGFVLAATFLLFHALRRPIRQLAREAGNLAEGDLDRPLRRGPYPLPEVGRIEGAIRRLAERLRYEYLNQEKRVREEAAKFETIIEEYIRHEVELKEANEAQERRLEELQALNVVSEVLITSDDLEDQLQTAIQTMCGVLHATSATIGLLTPDDPKMLRTRFYRSGHALERPVLMPLHEITGHNALSEGRIVACEDLFETSLGKLSQELAASEEFRAFLALPLINKGNPLGLITLMFEEPRSFSQEETDLASMITDQVAVAVERAALREEIHEKIRQLEASDKLKSEFIRNISHELRTPLNAIIGYTSILIEQIYGTINDDQHQALGKVIVHAKHLLKMINQILDLSRIDSGQMTIVAEEVEIGTLIEETTSIFAHLVREKQIELCKEVSPQIPPLMLDKTKVSQILTNLLDNAVKFTEQGVVTLRVDFDPHGERLRLEVADTGIGIEAEHLETIFEAFRQVDGTTTRKYGGSGLGLAITRELVQLMKGTIEARSRPGEGSTFTITIPVRPAPSLPQTSAEPPRTDRRAVPESHTR